MPSRNALLRCATSTGDRTSSSCERGRDPISIGCTMLHVFHTEAPMSLNRVVHVFLFVILFAARASAQSAIAGLVRDTSGAVLPGVTVEASSPSLIVGTRTAVTDGTG